MIKGITVVGFYRYFVIFYPPRTQKNIYRSITSTAEVTALSGTEAEMGGWQKGGQGKSPKVFLIWCVSMIESHTKALKRWPLEAWYPAQKQVLLGTAEISWSLEPQGSDR